MEIVYVFSFIGCRFSGCAQLSVVHTDLEVFSVLELAPKHCGDSSALIGTCNQRIVGGPLTCPPSTLCHNCYIFEYGIEAVLL
jgi:hypothetical protein